MNEQFEWKTLPFAYQKTNGNVRCIYKNGKWGAIEFHESEYINLHMAATCLHYGQECFEGLKAYRGKDNKIRLFRWKENALRLRRTAEYILSATVPDEIFHEALIMAVKKNIEFVPPYGSGASLYIRPLLIGIEPKVGVNPSGEYLFLVFVTPVGPYFKTGFKPSTVVVERDSDRAAPLGTGHIKVGGNYAASLKVTINAHKNGYSSAIYLDPKEKKYIDECGPANFFAIKGNTYITPDSHSILPSITNMSLQALAMKMGMKVEKRPVLFTELETFDEVGQCGTAAVISPIGKIFDPLDNKVFSFGDGENSGPISKTLYETLVGIQYGDIEDTFNWITIVE